MLNASSIKTGRRILRHSYVQIVQRRQKIVNRLLVLFILLFFFRIVFYAFRFYTRRLKRLRRIGLDDFNISSIKTAINSNTYLLGRSSLAAQK